MKTVKLSELKKGTMIQKIATFELSSKNEYLCVIDGEQCKVVK